MRSCVTKMPVGCIAETALCFHLQQALVKLVGAQIVLAEVCRASAKGFPMAAAEEYETVEVELEESDDEFAYEEVEVDEDEDTTGDDIMLEDLNTAMKNLRALGGGKDAAKPRETPGEVTRHPEVIDDFIRNFLVKVRISRTNHHCNHAISQPVGSVMLCPYERSMPWAFRPHCSVRCTDGDDEDPGAV